MSFKLEVLYQICILDKTFSIIYWSYFVHTYVRTSHYFGSRTPVRIYHDYAILRVVIFSRILSNASAAKFGGDQRCDTNKRSIVCCSKGINMRRPFLLRKREAICRLVPPGGARIEINFFSLMLGILIFCQIFCG